MTEAESDQKGVFEFGEWKDEVANGYGICTGPSESGKFEGEWYQGSQSSGIFTSNGQRYSGTWQKGMRHGLGKEVNRSISLCIHKFCLFLPINKLNYLFNTFIMFHSGPLRRSRVYRRVQRKLSWHIRCAQTPERGHLPGHMEQWPPRRCGNGTLCRQR